MALTKNFHQTVLNNKPLQIPGVINAYHSLLAKHSGYSAIYLSGGGVAAGSLGLPDLGISNLNDVIVDINRITDVCDLPLLVDIDTGFGNAFNIARTIKSVIKAGASACHIEDQEQAKRCGHRPNKNIVATNEMVDRIKASVDARTDDNFVIMARTDAIANEGLPKAIERMNAYVNAGADMIFAEAVTKLEDYATIKKNISVPILANITEFGMTPLFTKNELDKVGIDMILYPLSAFRAMNQAALNVYKSIIQDGTQANIINTMQTREELYTHLGYHKFEEILDQLAKSKL